MKKLALGALLAGLAVGCGGGSGGGVTLLDATIDAPMDCDPIKQSGCMTGLKCTWVVDIDGTATTDEIGHNGCVADGATADGAACADAVAATNGGADTCVAGDLCIAGKCKPICDPQATGSAQGACSTNFACSEYSGVFVASGTIAAGVCEPGCDPLTQKLLVGTGSLEACGSTTPTTPSGTCVPSGGFNSFHCAPTGPTLFTHTDRVAPLTDPHGTPFGNGCAPGFLPLIAGDASGTMTVLCEGLCAPVDVDMTMPNAATLHLGDATTLGKLIADATSIAGHATCGPLIKGNTGDNGNEDCRYMWPLLAGSFDPTKATTSPFNDTLGFCFGYAHYVDIDTDGDGKPDAPEKSCAALPTTAADTDPFGTALQNGCYSLATTKTKLGMAAGQHAPRLPRVNYRATYSNVQMTRHVFD